MFHEKLTFYCIICAVFLFQNNICEKNTTVFLNYVEIAFFQTPYYLSFMIYKDFISCNLTFPLMQNENTVGFKYFLSYKKRLKNIALKYARNNVKSGILFYTTTDFVQV